ncbi:MAG TPA: hypothetical protein VHY79_03605 [Rhizomicrobium sp.]|jgi:hypothetical protein|nr:hypothetical protein [Rhizomicrobium sp.]
MQDPNENEITRGRPLGLGGWGWFAVTALVVLLAVAIWYCIHAWGEVAGNGISSTGWVFLVLGVVLTVLVGGGLMGLLFYSSREGKDF